MGVMVLIRYSRPLRLRVAVVAVGLMLPRLTQMDVMAVLAAARLQMPAHLEVLEPALLDKVIMVV